MKTQRLALASDPSVAERAFFELRAKIDVACGIHLEPVYIPSYALLFQAIEAEPTLTAWAPPLVASDLLSAASAVPIATASRRGTTTYYSALVVDRGSPIDDLNDLRGARIGWVSKLSAAGYVVPRLFLQALEFDLSRLFAKELFFATHDRSAYALVRGDVDVIATHALFDPERQSFVLPPRAVGARLLATAGPIPGDVVLAGRLVEASQLAALRRGFASLRISPDGHLGRLLNVDRFEPMEPGHFEPLRRSRQRATEALSGPPSMCPMA